MKYTRNLVLVLREGVWGNQTSMDRFILEKDNFLAVCCQHVIPFLTNLRIYMSLTKTSDRETNTVTAVLRNDMKDHYIQRYILGLKNSSKSDWNWNWHKVASIHLNDRQFPQLNFRPFVKFIKKYYKLKLCVLTTGPVSHCTISPPIYTQESGRSCIAKNILKMSQPGSKIRLGRGRNLTPDLLHMYIDFKMTRLLQWRTHIVQFCR